MSSKASCASFIDAAFTTPDRIAHRRLCNLIKSYAALWDVLKVLGHGSDSALLSPCSAADASGIVVDVPDALRETFSMSPAPHSESDVTRRTLAAVAGAHHRICGESTARATLSMMIWWRQSS